MTEINIRLTSDASSGANVRRSPNAAQAVAGKEASAVKETHTAEASPVAAAASGKTLPQEVDSSRSEAAAIAETVERLTDRMQALRRELNFSVDEASGRTVITVKDSETDEVIRQIPAEEALRLAERLEEGQEKAVQGWLLASEA